VCHANQVIYYDRGITVGDLREQLKVFPDDAELSFSGVRFYRLKDRGNSVVQLEFQEQVYRENRPTTGQV
jgi:hypothetical protein